MLRYFLLYSKVNQPCVYVCVYVCVCVYICVCVYMCVCVHIYIYTHTYIYLLFFRFLPHLDHHRALSRILLKKQTQNKYFLGSNQVSDTGCMISEKTESPCPHLIHPLVVEMAHNLIITQINR